MNIYLFMHPCVYVHVRFSKSTTAHLDAFRKEFVRCPKIRGDANGVRKEDLVRLHTHAYMYVKHNTCVRFAVIQLLPE